MKDSEFLNWVAERMVHVYGESPNVDFVRRARAVAANIEAHESDLDRYAVSLENMEVLRAQVAEQRERDKLSETERRARLLARTITLDLYTRTDMALIRCMTRAGIDEPQDLITRLIHNADQMTDNGLARLTELPK